MKLKPLGHKSQLETATLPILTALVSVTTLTRRASPKNNSPVLYVIDLKHSKIFKGFLSGTGEITQLAKGLL